MITASIITQPFLNNQTQLYLWQESLPIPKHWQKYTVLKTDSCKLKRSKLFWRRPSGITDRSLKPVYATCIPSNNGKSHTHCEMQTPIPILKWLSEGLNQYFGSTQWKINLDFKWSWGTEKINTKIRRQARESKGYRLELGLLEILWSSLGPWNRTFLAMWMTCCQYRNFCW